MKQKHNGGFSLIEVLVAMVLLGALVVPTCSALVMCARLNAKSDDLLQAQLAVSSAVETLMAEGIKVDVTDGTNNYEDRFEGVEVTVSQDNEDTPYYRVEVKCTDSELEEVVITTYIRKAGGGT